MRIALLSCFYPFRGGISQFNANMYLELGKRHVVKAFNFTRQYPDFLFPGKSQFVSPQDEAEPIESERLLDSVGPFSWKKTAKAIAGWGPDAVVMSWWMSAFGPSMGYVAHYLSKRGIKVVSVLHNVIPHEKKFYDTLLTRYFLKGCTAHVTLCREVDGDLHSLGSFRSRQLFHPVYTHFGGRLPRSEAEKDLGLRPGMKNLLFFGLIREYKGLDILLEAFDTLPDDYQLIIAGEPYGSFDKYRQMIDASPGKDRIHCFLNYVRDSEVKVFFSAADLTVLPYRSATQSGVSSVSYHFEVPMEVTDVGGLMEAVGETGTGIVASKAEAGEIAAGIKRFFGDDALRKNCVESIRKEKERLSWRRFCDSLVNFILEL